MSSVILFFFTFFLQPVPNDVATSIFLPSLQPAALMKRRFRPDIVKRQAIQQKLADNLRFGCVFPIQVTKSRELVLVAETQNWFPGVSGFAQKRSKPRVKRGAK